MAEQDSHSKFWNSDFWDKSVRATLSPVMHNPRLTPKILFLLAVVPFTVVILVWVLTLLEQ
ncbi:MAG: hypothetical protein CLLPBCKN_004239 [Chroococcidiopsis cubana SAG 39.79]|jgi:hypothetical protein|uniref:Uncharacterized protein n=2 Tax=Chroococcidiopsis TaxID=54298 RepID=K9TYH3_CHRTP|nr:MULTISPECIES: hypothetical protein [Chroococcidiopsis]AFY87630.1 hypothetical protein Chro_2123 [Chroococcidiopsis thermalis PCC 7203]MDZ4874843.1 hypothetical protein [Chroococcidiopsis cubana SAG 39.79]RUT08080.1 hypothetical protein DSM107010_48740 [Chroococcidiopsis cubana SAG 39.79]URD52527.1 hypothetical protein M5J74_11130 [Chroococcidiopsis sp. CCNUC1]